MCDINIILSIITASPDTREQFILSNNDKKIIFPSFKLINCNNINLDIYNTIIKYFDNNFSIDMNSLLSIVNNIFLIDINSNNINILFPDNQINILYGLILPKYNLVSPYSWINFSFQDLSIPNELAIIGETIRRGF